ncbi:MAG: hypothetical protein NTZ38_00215 [Candidatus Taylorbacteria bacterium]|nr:hypothetical protein [Candidatus Taylorbacteria bacterium]
MNLITVIPLTRSKVAETLSYFTSSDVPVGAIIEVPLRSKSIHAIVMDAQPAQELKADIKNASFEIRRIGTIRASTFFPASFMAACKKLGTHYAANAGSVIDALIADTLLVNANKIAPPLPLSSKEFRAGFGETYAIQGDDEDRVSTWRSLVRQEFARKKSLSIYVPTIEDALRIRDSLTKGIEDYIFILHGNLAKKEIIDAWQDIAGSKHPVVVISTGSFSVLPRSDIETIIIERENGRGWRSIKTPYLDIRHALETIARSNGQNVYRADCLLSIETLRRLDEHEIMQGSPFKWHSISTAKCSLVDMIRPKDSVLSDRWSKEDAPIIENEGNEIGSIQSHEIKRKQVIVSDREGKPRFRVLSAELEGLIQKNRDDNSHLFIFAVRQGLASTTVCDDCGAVISCENCSSPMVLHTTKDSGKNYFMCHLCGDRQSAETACENCGGWRLTPLGIGIDRVSKEIQEKFPGADIFKIDTSTKRADAVMSRFLEKPGSILIGTEFAVTRLPEKIEHIAVASMDTLFALPDFRIPEKVIYLLVRLRSIATRSLIVQTRRASEPIFDFALKGNLSDFYRTTLEDRKRFDYPPFKVLVKISITGKKDAIAITMADIQKTIEPREIDIFPAFTATVRNNHIIHGLLKIPPKEWPDLELISKLKSLPPAVAVRVDPESLL